MQHAKLKFQLYIEIQICEFPCLFYLLVFYAFLLNSELRKILSSESHKEQ